jgi:hypothetical protein
MREMQDMRRAGRHRSEAQGESVEVVESTERVQGRVRCRNSPASTEGPGAGCRDRSAQRAIGRRKGLSLRGRAALRDTLPLQRS